MFEILERFKPIGIAMKSRFEGMGFKKQIKFLDEQLKDIINRIIRVL